MDWNKTYAAVWRRNSGELKAVTHPDWVPMASLIGIDEQAELLFNNTRRFLKHKPANDVLLWGSRGTGKSSLVKAALTELKDEGLRLIELFKTDLEFLPDIVDQIRSQPFRFIVFCDDFSFEENDTTYVVLKTILDGSIEARPDNCLLVVTSNRRHLLPEYLSENDGTKLVNGEIHYPDVIEEKLALSDRFGLWISFYPISDARYLEIVDAYFEEYSGDRDTLHREALAFSRQRASKSGRTALQFFKHRSETSGDSA
jgi:predicted AAA+ superfamily ATPase